MKRKITDIIASELNAHRKDVEGVITLIDEGCTIPFIARYRKEKTGGMDEVKIGEIAQRYERLNELVRRKETILKTISGQDKMTPELERRIAECWDATELEDIYLPFKPKRRTRAQVAREQGLEPLAQILLMQRDADIERTAKRFVKEGVVDVDAALKGAQDIVAEIISEDETVRNRIRTLFRRNVMLCSKVVKVKKDTPEAAKYSDYFDFSEPLRRTTGNRLLAIRRAEAEGLLRVNIEIDEDEAINNIQRLYVRGGGRCRQLMVETIADAYKRLLAPSMENEFAVLSKLRADEEAVGVFAENLRV